MLLFALVVLRYLLLLFFTVLRLFLFSYRCFGSFVVFRVNQWARWAFLWSGNYLRQPDFHLSFVCIVFSLFLGFLCFIVSSFVAFFFWCFCFDVFFATELFCCHVSIYRILWRHHSTTWQRYTAARHRPCQTWFSSFCG